MGTASGPQPLAQCRLAYGKERGLPGPQGPRGPTPPLPSTNPNMNTFSSLGSLYFFRKNKNKCTSRVGKDPLTTWQTRVSNKYACTFKYARRLHRIPVPWHLTAHLASPNPSSVITLNLGCGNQPEAPLRRCRLARWRPWGCGSAAEPRGLAAGPARSGPRQGSGQERADGPRVPSPAQPESRRGGCRGWTHPMGEGSNVISPSWGGGGQGLGALLWACGRVELSPFQLLLTHQLPHGHRTGALGPSRTQCGQGANLATSRVFQEPGLL